MPEPMSWKIPVIIEAVFGATDDPDKQKSFDVYCMMAPAPDILCTVANPNDRITALAKARFLPLGCKSLSAGSASSSVCSFE